MKTIGLLIGAYLLLGGSSSGKGQPLSPPPPPPPQQPMPTQGYSWDAVGANFLNAAINAASKAFTNSQYGGSGYVGPRLDPDDK